MGLPPASSLCISTSILSVFSDLVKNGFNNEIGMGSEWGDNRCLWADNGVRMGLEWDDNGVGMG